MTFLYHIHRPEHKGNLKEGYIGITDRPSERFARHLWGVSGSTLLVRALNKYKDCEFTLVSEGSRDEMLRLELYLRPCKMGWNLVPGGGAPPNHLGKVMSQSQKDKIGAANRIARSSGTWIVRGVPYISCVAAAEATGHQKKSIIKWCKNGLHDCSFIPK